MAKPFTVTVRVPQFLEEFPDAKVIYMVRDPMNVIPSTLSLVSGPLDQRFGFWSQPEEKRQRWVRHVCDGIVDLYRGFYDDWNAGLLPPESVFVCTYDRLVGDFEGLMTDLLVFLDVEPSDELLADIRRTAAEQAGRVSAHKYDLEKFGLDEAWIRRECAFVYDTFLGVNS